MPRVVEGQPLPGVHAYCARMRQQFKLAAEEPSRFPCINVTEMLTGWEEATGLHIFDDSELQDGEDYSCNVILQDYTCGDITTLLYALIFEENRVNWTQAREDVHAVEDFVTDDSGTDSWYCFVWDDIEYHLEWLNAEPPEDADPNHMFVQVRAKPVEDTESNSDSEAEGTSDIEADDGDEDEAHDDAIEL